MSQPGCGLHGKVPGKCRGRKRKGRRNREALTLARTHQLSWPHVRYSGLQGLPVLPDTLAGALGAVVLHWCHQRRFRVTRASTQSARQGHVEMVSPSKKRRGRATSGDTAGILCGNYSNQISSQLRRLQGRPPGILWGKRKLCVPRRAPRPPSSIDDAVSGVPESCSQVLSSANLVFDDHDHTRDPC